MMQSVVSELPLAFFSTLGPIGAGTFAAISFALFTCDDRVCRMKLGTWGLLPFAFAVVGLLGAFVHLGDALHAPFALTGVASSPLSQEICAALAFLIAAAACIVACRIGKEGSSAAKWSAVIAAVVGIVFAVFVGKAYMVDTITSWNTPLSVIEPVGACLFGGAALGALVVTAAGVCADKKVLGVVVVAGGVVFAIALVAHVFTVSGMASRLVDGAQLAANVMPLCVVSCVLVAIAIMCTVAWAKSSQAGMPLIAVILACSVLGVFAGRLVFYGLQLSGGLCL